MPKTEGILSSGKDLSADEIFITKFNILRIETSKIKCHNVKDKKSYSIPTGEKEGYAH